MKIIFDASPMIVERTGIAYYTERLVTSLAKKYPDDVELVGFYYNFLGRRDTSHMPVMKNLRYMGASIVPSKIVYQLRRFGIEFPVEALALQRADFILFPNIIGYPSLYQTPSAPVIHDLTYIDLPEYVSAKLRSDLIRFVPKQIKRSKFIVTVSEFTKQRIHDYYGVPAKDIYVTPIPPTPVKTYPAARTQAALKELGITKPFILFIGTIEPRKNVSNLIDAFAALPKALRDSHQLVIAGRIGWYCTNEIAKLKQAAEQGLNVVHLGYVTEEAKDILCSQATLFSSASHYEGFGMPVLEAMSYGTACALSDIPVFREVAGDAAHYFDQSDPQAIARCFAQLLGDKAALQRSAKQGIARAQAYNWDAVAETVYNAIAASLKK